MEYRWRHIAPPDPADTAHLQEVLGIDTTLCQLLAQRGIRSFEEARSFFRPSLDRLHDPFLMKDMDRAVARIDQARQVGEKILIYGDYDVDGTTSVALLYSFLRQHCPEPLTYIPDRYKEGYGVSQAGVEYARENGAGLIIALDCGIKALRQIQYASELGLDFIVCDHHRPGPELPPALAILDPKQAGCSYPYDELSGCGVGFKLVQALCQKWQLPDSQWRDLLDLTAISIGADIVPITGENRLLAHFGLKKINSRPRPGIAQLIAVSNRKGHKLNITDVVFLLGPRINAAGRIAHGQLAVELLTSDDATHIEELSHQINQHNNTRKELDSSITESALQMIHDNGEVDRFSTVVYEPGWHKGVIGIVASRLIEQHYRPTIVFTESREMLAGSARSVKGFDVYEALDECSDILEQFGGHKYAAGMTLRKERFEEFKQRFEEVVKARIHPEQRTPEIEIDARLDLTQITWSFFKILQQFAPFGPQNMAPTFETDHLYDTGRSRGVGQDEAHLRLELRQRGKGPVISGIGFGLGHKIKLLKTGQPVSVAYHLEENEFNGQRTIQMRIKDLKPTAEVAHRDEAPGPLTG